MKRVVLIVLDSLGIGELPDSERYGDVGSNTLSNIASKMDKFELPNMERMGLGNIEGVKHINKSQKPTGSFARLAEESAGKDTTTGHWEMAGLKLKKAFPLYPDGFPQEIIKVFEEKIGTKSLANYASSGTQIIEELGDESVRTGYPIVYTSADSVFQIAAHEGVTPIDRLYEMCAIAREILQGEHAVGRVIARPFEGVSGQYIRTDRRKDFALKPFSRTMLDYIKEASLEVKAVGKIEDIFCGTGITQAVHTHGNMDGVDTTLRFIKEEFEGLIFTNLVDFDMLYGHRNNVVGYANALIEFDARLVEILDALKAEDILMITADHGCDPTFPGTDHTREHVPLLIYGKNVIGGVNLKTRNTFSDIAKTVLDYLGLSDKSDISLNGSSFLNEIIMK